MMNIHPRFRDGTEDILINQEMESIEVIFLLWNISFLRYEGEIDVFFFLLNYLIERRNGKMEKAPSLNK
jgi:hypothetical protein